MADANTTLSALGVLLEQHRGPLSKREAARRAGISEGRWRQIVTGQQKAGGGIVVPVNPRKDTVIAMAEAVGADTNEALLAAGFDPVDLTSQMSSPDAIVPDTAEAIRNDPLLLDEAKQHLLNQYELLLRLSPPEVSVRRSSQAGRRATTPPGDDQQLRAVARGGDPSHRGQVRKMARDARKQYEREQKDTGKDE